MASRVNFIIKMIDAYFEFDYLGVGFDEYTKEFSISIRSSIKSINRLNVNMGPGLADVSKLPEFWPTIL